MPHGYRPAGALVALVLGAMLTPAPAVHAQEAILGEIRFFAGNFAPRGWALCNGQTLAIADNQALFSLLGTTYGGDGRNTFSLPDMRGRMPLHPGTGPGLPPVTLGARGGAPSVTLSAAEMPAHAHTATSDAVSTSTTTVHANARAGLRNAPDGGVLANGGQDRIYTQQPPDVTLAPGAATTATTTTVTTTVASAGGGQPVPIQPPYAAINCIISTEGYYPGR